MKNKILDLGAEFEPHVEGRDYLKSLKKYSI